MTLEMWSVIVGLLVMGATSMAKNPGWSTSRQTLLFGAISVLAAVGQLFIAGDLVMGDELLADVGKTFSVIVTTATLAYNLRFKTTQLNTSLEAVGFGATG